MSPRFCSRCSSGWLRSLSLSDWKKKEKKRRRRKKRKENVSRKKERAREGERESEWGTGIMMLRKEIEDSVWVRAPEDYRRFSVLETGLFLAFSFVFLSFFSRFFFPFLITTGVTWLLLYIDCSSGDGNSSVNNLLFEMWSSDIKRFSPAAVAPFWIQMCAFTREIFFALFSNCLMYSVPPTHTSPVPLPPIVLCMSQNIASHVVVLDRLCIALLFALEQVNCD